MHVEFSGCYHRRAVTVVALLFFCLEVLQAATLEIQPAGGVYTNNLTVALSAAGQEIRYTLDGSVPGTNSLLYSAPLVLSNSVVLKARAVDVHRLPGPIVLETYTFLDTNVVGF